MNKAKRREMFERWRAANPHPQTELNWRNPFELLIAVILSAQATDKSVNVGTRGLFAEAPDPASMLKLGEAGLIKHIKHIGLYQSKAKHVLETCALLLEHHDGEVPREREALEALAGVGRKTANVVLNTAFGQATMAVDTHIFRVANRTGLAPGKDVLAVEMKLLRFIEAEFLHDAHHWLILHGRYVCKARKPDCPTCMVADLCDMKNKTKVEALIQTPTKKSAPGQAQAQAKHGPSTDQARTKLGPSSGQAIDAIFVKAIDDSQNKIS